MRTLLPLAVLGMASVALAQNCFNGNYGTRLGLNTLDTVYPMQSIGFTFPFAGATYTNIHVNDHGFVQLSTAGVPAPLLTTAAALYTPTTTNFAAGGPKIAPLYCDMELTGGGECFIRSSATACVVTWLNVRSYGIAAPRFTFQLTLDPSGTITFTYGPGVTNNSTWGGVSDNGICGVTPAGGVTLPASIDLSAGGSTTNNSTFENWAAPNGFDMANNTLLLVPGGTGFTYVLLGAPANCASTSNYGVGCDSMALTGFGLPSLGNAAFTLRASNVPVVSPIGFFGFGSLVVNPGIPLDGIGMTGCSSYTSLDIGLFSGGPNAAGVSEIAFGIPNVPALVGAVLAAQSLALSLANPANLAVSNGTQINLGY